MKTLLFVAAVASVMGTGASAGTRSVAPSRAQRVDVVLSDFAFTPMALHLRQGRTYRLHFANQGSGGHNFTAPEFFAASRIEPADVGAVIGGRVELARGESRDVRLVPGAGAYRVICTHPLHTTFGMTGSVIVD